MTIFSYILGVIVLVYTVAYAVTSTIPIVRYQKCVKAGEFKVVEGRIGEKIDEQNKAILGTMVNLCLPQFDFEVGGKELRCQSSVRYRNATIGQTAEIRYCERTNEAWVTQDIPAMKKNIVVRTLTMLAILALLVITDVML